MAKIGDVTPRWYIVDAAEERLGRAAVEIARMLQGKHRPTYTPQTDTGDFIVLINAEKIQVTGKKNDDKIYDWYTGYPGGRKTRTLAEMRQRRPEAVIKLAVRRMLPKTRLGRNMLKKLKVYAGVKHPHAAQKPETLSFGTGGNA